MILKYMGNDQWNNQQMKQLTQYSRLFIHNNEIITDKQIKQIDLIHSSQT